jgi:spore maturation protein CgeB
MRIVCFTHALTSCWNHGNAHFLRGVLSDLLARGHAVRSYESRDAWSRLNLIDDQGPSALAEFDLAYPELRPCVRLYRNETPTPAELDEALDDADLVLVHEWTPPSLIAAIGDRRRRGGRFLLLFHDTHHRAVSDPAAIHGLDLSGYDGVLAFGATLAAVYRREGWGERVFVWHEAADTRRFHPPTQEQRRAGAVWIGNWGDEERSQELRSYLLQPCAELKLPLDIHGVRYPAAALAALDAAGACYRGWLPNPRVPGTFARHLLTVHVPRRFYAQQLVGIPTIRVFEALACGIPLICAPWDDAEALFRPGEDFLLASNPEQMRGHLEAVIGDAALRQHLVSNGLETIRTRHSCAHRVDQLLDIVARLRES